MREKRGGGEFAIVKINIISVKVVKTLTKAKKNELR